MWCANHGVGMKFSDEQRLIVYMLCGIQRALKVENELNPDFVEKVTATGEEWAIGEKYPWLLRSEELSEPDYVSETRSILQTFRTIRQSINNLDPADAARVASGAAASILEFDGFDGNNESEHLAAAGLITRDAGRWPELADLVVNSHSSTLDRYRVLVEGVAAFQARNPGGLLSSEQLLELAELVRRSRQQ